MLAFTESSFFLIPPDALLIPMLAAGARRWTYYAFLTTLASVLGALFGYAIAALAFDALGEPVIRFYGLTEEFNRVGALYETHTFLTVFTAAFTPIPFKVFVLAGGFFKVSLVPFLFAAILGRGLRFYLVAFLAARYGPRGAELVLLYFKRITFVVVVLALIAGAVFAFR